jgi:hypothetical protein
LYDDKAPKAEIDREKLTGDLDAATSPAGPGFGQTPIDRCLGSK